MRKLVIALAIYLSVSVARAEPASTLEALCKNARVELRSISEVQRLIENLDSVECPQITRNALLELQLLLDSGLDDACSELKVEQVRAFYDKYVARNGAATGGKIPESLREFFLSFGLRVSGACKRSLLEHLIQVGRLQIPSYDLQNMDTLYDHVHLKSRALPTISTYEAALSAAEVGEGVADDVGASDTKLVLKTIYGDYIRSIQKTCKHVLRPIYGPTMRKLTTLSSVGFNPERDEFLNTLAKDNALRFWFKAIYTCETLSTIKIVNFDKEDEDEGTHRRTLVILGEEPAEETDEFVESMTMVQLVKKQRLGDEVVGVGYDAQGQSVNQLGARRRRDKVLSNLLRKINWTAVTMGLGVVRHVAGLKPAYWDRSLDDVKVLRETFDDVSAYLKASARDTNPDSSVPIEAATTRTRVPWTKNHSIMSIFMLYNNIADIKFGRLDIPLGV